MGNPSVHSAGTPYPHCGSRGYEPRPPSRTVQCGHTIWAVCMPENYNAQISYIAIPTSIPMINQVTIVQLGFILHSFYMLILSIIACPYSVSIDCHLFVDQFLKLAPFFIYKIVEYDSELWDCLFY